MRRVAREQNPTDPVRRDLAGVVQRPPGVAQVGDVHPRPGDPVDRHADLLGRDRRPLAVTAQVGIELGTELPFAPSRSAIARPMPREQAVTIATTT
jgi:hypothetical protein